MARKPIEVEMAGLLTPRERIWRAVRKLRKFTRLELQDATEPLVLFGTLDTYVNSLVAGGYLVTTREPGPPGTEQAYRLVRDAFEAPRLNVRGEEVNQGLPTLAMWRAMKVLRDFDHIDIARAASVGEVVVKVSTAKSYVNVLKRAGYFMCIRASKPGTPARYRLVRDTGAHAPAITRRKVVFDRNTGEFLAQQTAQEVCDGLE